MKERNPNHEDKTLYIDYETCVLEAHPECQYVQGVDINVVDGNRGQMSLFCGHDPVRIICAIIATEKCFYASNVPFQICHMWNNPRALQMAKQNVIDYYPVVGVTEMFNETLEVLETKLPTYFHGATKAYKEIGDKFSNESNKKQVSEEIKKLVRGNLTNEYEFYEFCKQRLINQIKEIRNKKL